MSRLKTYTLDDLRVRLANLERAYGAAMRAGDLGEAEHLNRLHVEADLELKTRVRARRARRWRNGVI